MDIFLARQPIFNKNMDVYGYELLYRNNNVKNLCQFFDAKEASLEVIAASFVVIGLTKLTGGKKAFINFTEDLLQEEFATILPKEDLIIEVLEDVEPTKENVEACHNLVKAGYKIALDDFEYKAAYNDLINISSIIKVDFINSSRAACKELINKYKNSKILFLAEKIETQEDFECALAMGYSLFQGYHFCKPMILSAKKVEPFKLNAIELVKLVNEDVPNFKEIAKVIENDVSLSFNLLKLVNSLAFSRGTKIKSILQAISLLGEKEIRKWITLVAIEKISSDKTKELLRLSIIRAKFCEVLCHKFSLGNRKTELFLLGLFSLMDAMMDVPKEDVFLELPISEELKEALIKQTGIFADCYKIMIAYERANWSLVAQIAGKYKLAEAEIATAYYEAVKWLNENIE